ncbi:MAG TPA: hypothetical protein VFK05_28035 [Polyangiaceae bacterium]|nr:hypothetical protein [Polyangiaceae bacterium]
MTIRWANVLVWAALALAAPLWVGCGGSSTPADSVGTANQRLGGSWRLLRFAPSDPLDLPLQAVLTAEQGQLIVTFNQGQYTAVGPGVNLTGRYEVTSAAGDQVSLIMYDPQNVARHFSAQFVEASLHFQSNDKPWTGFGEFARAQ